MIQMSLSSVPPQKKTQIQILQLIVNHSLHRHQQLLHYNRPHNKVTTKSQLSLKTNQTKSYSNPV